MRTPRFKHEIPSDPAKWRKELIGRGTLFVVGLVLLLGAWKLWGAAQWYADEDAKWNDRMGYTQRHHRRVTSAPYLYTGTVALAVAGTVTCAMSLMSIGTMHRLFHRNPPITHEDVDDWYGPTRF